MDGNGDVQPFQKWMFEVQVVYINSKIYDLIGKNMVKLRIRDFTRDP